MAPASSGDARAPTMANLEARAAALRERLPAGFHVLVEPPFVVIGDEPAPIVTRRARSTVAWAVRLLRQDFFDRDPDRVLDVWLFRDADSYRRHTSEFFDEEPRTPFGYFSPQHDALIMNIGTGGGTLVHEIVHPFLRANFRRCPAWFNEGLGSLFEQCHEHDGRIRGLTNWRLDGLQEAIEARRDLPFERLFALTDEEFYGEDSGLHYAEARYVCYYLQELGLLREFYRRFQAEAVADPTGIATFRAVLDREDLDAVQDEWRGFVSALRFPEEQD